MPSSGVKRDQMATSWRCFPPSVRWIQNWWDRDCHCAGRCWTNTRNLCFFTRLLYCTCAACCKALGNYFCQPPTFGSRPSGQSSTEVWWQLHSKPHWYLSHSTQLFSVSLFFRQTHEERLETGATSVDSTDKKSLKTKFSKTRSNISDCHSSLCVSYPLLQPPLLPENP